MSKRTGAQKRKVRRERLDITVAEYDELHGRPSREERHKKKAEEAGISWSQYRRDHFHEGWTSEKKVKTLEKFNIFGHTDQYRVCVAGKEPWQMRLFGRLNQGFKDNRQDNLTRLGERLFMLQPFVKDTQWSILSRNDPLIGEFEQEFLGKMRSRSTYIAKDFLAILQGWSVPSISLNDNIVSAFKKVGLGMPYVDGWKLDEMGEAVQPLDKDTNAGLPWMAKKHSCITDEDRRKYGIISLDEKYRTDLLLLEKAKKLTVETLDKLPSAITKAKERLVMVRNGERPTVRNITGLRTESSHFTEEGKDPFKQRLVWQVPYDELIVQSLFFHKLKNRILNEKSEFSSHLWGSLQARTRQEKLGDTRILGLVDKAKDWGSLCISVDYSAFDQHITQPLMSLGLQELGSHCALTEEEQKYELYVLSESELWTSWGIMHRQNGIPSGCYLTNLMDSLINAAFCEYVGIVEKTEVDYVVNGDDCCFISKSDVGVPRMTELANDFGMELHPDKQWIRGDAFLFNKEVFSHALGGSTPFLHRVLNSMMRHDQQKRVLSGLEDIAANFSQLRRLAHHPQRKEFLAWLLNALDPQDSVTWHPWNPANFKDQLLPPVVGRMRYTVTYEEKDWHAVETYKDDWFWEQCCSC